MSEDSKPISVMFDHCKNVYEEMVAQAREETIDSGGSMINGVHLVYEGHFTKLFAGLELSTPYYTSVKNILVRMGCIEQLRRGGGNSPSRWVLRYPPTEEAFKTFEEQKSRNTGKVAVLEQQFKDLRQEYYKLRNDVDTLLVAIHGETSDV